MKQLDTQEQAVAGMIGRIEGLLARGVTRTLAVGEGTEASDISRPSNEPSEVNKASTGDRASVVGEPSNEASDVIRPFNHNEASEVDESSTGNPPNDPPANEPFAIPDDPSLGMDFDRVVEGEQADHVPEPVPLIRSAWDDLPFLRVMLGHTTDPTFNWQDGVPPKPAFGVVSASAWPPESFRENYKREMGVRAKYWIYGQYPAHPSFMFSLSAARSYLEVVLPLLAQPFTERLLTAIGKVRVRSFAENRVRFALMAVLLVETFSTGYGTRSLWLCLGANVYSKSISLAKEEKRWADAF
ncbi:hypothetical protein IAU60_006341 [Kwoniella sp. DSM 27419]